MLFTVVITTRDRASLVGRAIASVLVQEGPQLELVVVDDGSTDSTPEVLAELSDPRVRTVSQANMGLGAARNTGLGLAQGDWVMFLDDDDWVLPGWLEGHAGLVDEGVGLTFCAAEYRTPDGRLLDRVTPRPLGRVFHDHTGVTLAGAWAVRTAVLREAGGYDPRLRCSHQTDVILRVCELLERDGLASRCTDVAGVCIERRAVDDRPMSSPEALYSGTGVFLDAHRRRLAVDPVFLADFHAVRGVNAAKLGYWTEARTALRAAVLTRPLDPRHWSRLAVACLPPLGRRVWAPSPARGGRGRVDH